MTEPVKRRTYERVTYRRGRGRITVILENIQETTVDGVPAIIGREVDSEGVPVEPSAAYLREHGAETGDKIHAICTELIAKRTPLVMSLTYGCLMVANDERTL